MELRLGFPKERLRLARGEPQSVAPYGQLQLWTYSDGLGVWISESGSVYGITGTVLTRGKRVVVRAGQDPPERPRGWKRVSAWGSCWGMVFSTGYQLPGDSEGTLFIQGGLEPLAVHSLSYWPAGAEEEPTEYHWNLLFRKWSTSRGEIGASSCVAPDSILSR